MGIALLTILLIPWAITGTLAFHILGSSPEDAIGPAATTLRENADRWTDPAWQAETATTFAQDNLEFILYANDTMIYRSNDDPYFAGISGDTQSREIRRVEIRDDTTHEVTAFAYVIGDAVTSGAPEGLRNWYVPIVALSTLAITLAGVAWFFGRTVVRPLSATSRAARQIATGNLDVTLPSSRVREVAEVNTAFVAMSDALRESITHQAEMEQERRLFIGAVVHDLRTPLFSLRGYLEGFAKGLANTPEKQARYLAIAQERTAALERLVSDLFDFARFEYLEQGSRRDPLDLVALLHRGVEAARPRADEKKIDLQLIASSSPAIIAGDEHLLARALENVLDNAFRHTPTGGQVVLTYDATETDVTVSVADNGPGIPTDDLPHLFTPLFRGEKSRNRHTGGAGLGLTIAQRIFRDHGGDLTAHNAREGGAVFTGTLRRGQADETAFDGEVRQPGYPASDKIASTATPIGVA